MIPALGLLRVVPVWAWALAGLAFALWWQTDSLAEARDDLAAVRVELTVAQDANATNATTIADLRAATDEWVKACGADPETARAVIASLTRGETKARGEAADLRRQLRRAADADPTVDEWMRGPVPRAVADGLRNAAPDRPN